MEDNRKNGKRVEQMIHSPLNIRRAKSAAERKYEEWCASPYYDEETKRELQGLTAAKIEEQFGSDLEFGTGGMRGIMGAGTNRMNRYVVRRATQGLANALLKQYKTQGERRDSQEGKEARPALQVAIAYDSRNNSAKFAMEAAVCLCANGIRVWLYESLRPTPQLSFTVRRLSCAAGIVITASHNPPEYNGYKVYGGDGAQITAPMDREIMEQIQDIHSTARIRIMDETKARESGLLRLAGDDMDVRYLQSVKSCLLEAEAVRQTAGSLRIVYTPLHGTGNVPVRRLLKELGFVNTFIVEEQAVPDGDFPTVSSPNPENPEAFSLALRLAKQADADLVFATDPDADRFGAYVKKGGGGYLALTGNMAGALICEYRLERLKEAGKLPENGAIVTTIVSGKMTEAIAARYGVHRMETLTGFKYIGEQIRRFEQEGNYEFLFGYEESFGCLAGTYARDKDAACGVLCLCEAAAYYRSRGISLAEQMQKLWDTYGYYQEHLVSRTAAGMDGMEKIRQTMERLRREQPDEIMGYQVQRVRDYLTGTVYNKTGHPMGKTKLPASNVLYYELEDSAWCCVRPSGTEPKVKFYCGVRGKSGEDAIKRSEELCNWNGWL